MPKPDIRPPKVFLSYSQTSEEYKERVRRLAVRFVEEGHVEVVFDQWDVEPGHDLAAFMERCVGDPLIDYVLILCDPRYAERADGRKGGVGAEALVISQEVFADARQTKFIPVILQRDEEGVPRVPIYLRGRWHFDLSDPEKEDAQFENLVKHLHGVDRGRPKLGPPPAYLDATRPALRTGRRLQYFRRAVIDDLPHQGVKLRDYLEALAGTIADSTLVPEPGPEFLDDWVVETIDALRPYRDEFVEMVVFLARYDSEERFASELHLFFEQLLGARVKWRGGRYSEEYEGAAIGFVTWELFLYAVAALLREERFGHVGALYEPYYAPDDRGGSHTGIRSFGELEPGFRLLDEVRNRRLGLNRYSLTAGMMREGATLPEVPFESLRQADVVCWLRSALAPGDRWDNPLWWPRLLTDANVGSLPLFERAVRASTFAGLARALGVRDREDLVQRWATISDSSLPTVERFWGGRRRWETLVQIDRLGTRT